MVTAVAPEPFIFLPPLDPFGEHADAEAPAERDDVWQIAWLSVRRVDVGDEFAVDLDLVERQRAERAEPRIAGAEIVDRELHAHRAQVLEDAAAMVGIAGRDAFGQLDLERAGAELMALQRALDQDRQIVAFELEPGHVDRDAQIGKPLRRPNSALRARRR